MDVYSILEFMANNKVVIVGAAVTMSEVFVVFWNMRKKLKDTKETVVAMRTEPVKTTWKDIAWIVNPINIFRKP